MFNCFDEKLPYAYSFSWKNSNIRKLFHDNKQGGLVNIFTRMIDLETDKSPFAARYSFNGNPFTYVSFFDFNSMVSLFQENSTVRVTVKFFSSSVIFGRM